MTRINVVPIEELNDAHLALEHYELVRVYRLVRLAIGRGETPDDWRNPSTYRMGAGHVRFFYPRLGFVQRREIQLHVEMLYRGLSLIREEQELHDIPAEWFGGYEPTEEAIAINRQRLQQRIDEFEMQAMRGYFTYKDEDT